MKRSPSHSESQRWPPAAPSKCGPCCTRTDSGNTASPRIVSSTDIVARAKLNPRRLPMRFLSIYRQPETGIPPTMEEMTRMGKIIEEWTKAGALLGAEGCLPSAMGARVRRRELDSSRWSFHRDERGGRRLRSAAGELQGR